MNNIFLKIVTVFFLLFNVSNAQDITNTLGTSGLFTIKDGSTNYLTLSQSNGTLTLNRNLAIPNTSSETTGVIMKGVDYFIHNYGGFNTFIGSASGNFSMTGLYNTAVGMISLLNNTTGERNSAFGHQSLYLNTEGNNNSAFGMQSLLNNTTGNENSAFGVLSLSSNSSGHYNSAFGYYTLASNSTGENNSAFGNSSLSNNTTGTANSAFGNFSLWFNQLGYYNCAFGDGALFASNSNSNSAFGNFSMGSNTGGSSNSAFGDHSLATNTTGKYNSAFGSEVLFSNSTGYPNSAFGTFSQRSNTIGRENTAVGFKSLYTNQSGFQNTAVGDSALYNSTGNYNTAIGYNAGSNVTTGANLTLIGIDANPSAPTAIDEITLGNIYVQTLRSNATTITSLSDRRDKKNIEDLTLGLDFITKLKPRQFNWDKRDWYKGRESDGSKMQNQPTAGFIAQELDEIQTIENAEWLDLVLKNNLEKWEATPGNLFPVLVKAVQELKQEKDEEIAELKIENESLEKRLSKYEEFQTMLVRRLEQLELVDLNSIGQLVNAEDSNQD